MRWYCVIYGILLFTVVSKSHGKTYVGASMNRFKYEEPGVMSQEGNLWGVELGHFFKNSYGLWELGGEFHRGDLTYKGQGLFDPSISITRKTNHELWHFHGIQTFGSHAVRPRIGLSYRYWNDKNGPNYQRETSYLYIPIGLQLKLNFNLFMNLDYYYFVRGKNESDIAGGVKLNQKNGQGYSLNLHYFWSPQVYLKVKFTYWDIDDSELGPNVPGETDLFFVEPHNKTYHSSFVVGYIF